MALASTLYATDGGAGLQDGTSLANAAGIDAGVAGDIWSIVNADVPAAGGTTVKLCADAEVAVTASATVVRDGLSADPFWTIGRNAADSADAQVALDAGGGAFPVFTLTTADYWNWSRLTARDTDGLTPNNGWTVGANADQNKFHRCRAISCFAGFNTSAALYTGLLLCEASGNADDGIAGASNGTRMIACVMDSNDEAGVDNAAMCVGCLSSNNGDDGFSKINMAAGCVAYNNDVTGFDPLNSGAFLNCLAVSNASYGMDTRTGGVFLVNFAHYNNTSGAIQDTQYIAVNTIALTADPFVNAAGRDFRLNTAAGGGALLKQIGYLSADGNWTDYSDVGVAQEIARRIHMIG